MNTISVEDSASLDELVSSLTPGETVVITRGGTPVAWILANDKRTPGKGTPVTGTRTLFFTKTTLKHEEPETSRRRRAPRTAGSAKGQLVILAEDDEHLSHFAEYMG